MQRKGKKEKKTSGERMMMMIMMIMMIVLMPPLRLFQFANVLDKGFLVDLFGRFIMNGLAKKPKSKKKVQN